MLKTVHGTVGRSWKIFWTVPFIVTIIIIIIIIVIHMQTHTRKRQWDSNPGSSALEADALTNRPTRRSGHISLYVGDSSWHSGGDLEKYLELFPSLSLSSSSLSLIQTDQLHLQEQGRGGCPYMFAQGSHTTNWLTLTAEGEGLLPCVLSKTLLSRFKSRQRDSGKQTYE